MGMKNRREEHKGFEGGGGFNNNRNRGGFSRGPRDMHKAKCADCGKDCEVPFKPTEGRDVYCRECFSKNRPPRRF